jgi:hypothetical protein
MKLRQLSSEIALYELREQIGNLLAESISDYFALTAAKLRNDKEVDLDQLAGFISGLKVIGDPDHRASMTKADIGINPNNVKELFNTLNSITKDGKGMPSLTADVFIALKTITPSLFKKTRAELEVLESGTKAQKSQAINDIQAFASKVNQLFYKLKHGAVQPKDKAVTADVGDAFDNVGGLPS